jgi:hypothetical protein
MNAYKILVGEAEGKRPLGRPSHRWEVIKMDLREIGCGGMEWIDLARDKDQWRTVVESLSGRATGGCTRRAQLDAVS